MKLVVLSGPLEGRVVELVDGNNFIGRAEENLLAIPSNQVSRRHALLAQIEGRIYLEDLGSSNGTFVNGQRLAQRQRVELRAGVRFQVGESIVELSVDGRPSQAPLSPPAAPTPTVAPGSRASGTPALQVFPAAQPKEPAFWSAYRVIAFLGWRGQMILLGLLLMALLLGGVVAPLLSETQSVLSTEVVKRGESIAKALALRNGEYLRQRQETSLDVKQTLSEPGVSDAYILNKDLLILSPVERRGTALSNNVSKKARNAGTVVIEEDTNVERGNDKSGVYHIAVPIRVWNAERGIPESYGVAYIIYRARDLAGEAAGTQIQFIMAASIVAFAAIVFLVALFILTNRPLKALGEDAELALRGDLRSVESRARWKELMTLAQVFNRSLDLYHQSVASARVQEAAGPSFLAGADGSAVAQEDARIEAIAGIVYEGVLMTDAMQKVTYINQAAARLFGTTPERAKGRHVMELSQNPEVIGPLLDLLKMLFNSEQPLATVSVNLMDAKGPRKVDMVGAGVRNRTGQLTSAAIVIR